MQEEKQKTGSLLEAESAEEKIVATLKKVADKYSIQYALLLYIYYKKLADFRELFKTYNELSENQVVREATVRKQLA